MLRFLGAGYHLWFEYVWIVIILGTLYSKTVHESPGRPFSYMLCMLTGRVRLVSKPFIYLKSLEELSRYRNGDPWDQLLLGSFRSIPQPHESLAILPGEPTELATLSCSTRRLVSLCCGGQRFCCLRPSFMGNPGGKMNCVIGARWKKWPRATCNLWAHNVDLATMFFFPLSLSLQLGVVPQIWQTWNDLSTASEGVKMHLSQASARRRLVALRIMTEQRFSDATWGFRNNLCKGVGQDHSKSMTQGIANVICFPSYLSNVHGMVAIFFDIYLELYGIECGGHQFPSIIFISSLQTLLLYVPRISSYHQFH